MIQSLHLLSREDAGEAKGRAETLLEVLHLRFGHVPMQVVLETLATRDLTLLTQWVEPAVRAPTMDAFRQITQLGERAGNLAPAKGAPAQPTVSRAQFAHAGAVRAVTIMLELKFESIPQDLVNAILSTRDFDKLDRWFRAAKDAASLADFRQAANL